ncbi:MAG: TadE/TadG family type IV pilus assembly protein [Syntrophorhabdales bacterium]|jgi:Flp pilus assembly protein TadG
MIRAESFTGRERGTSLIEFCIVVPILATMLFAVVDIGRLVSARLIITNVSREGANLASRDLKSGNDLITYLQDSSSPIDLVNNGKIYVTYINAGTSAKSPDPTIDTTDSTSGGNLNVASAIKAGATDLGLTPAIYNHLVFNTTNQVADIMGVTVVEVYYTYTPITPIAQFIPGILNNGTSSIIASTATYCMSGGL